MVEPDLPALERLARHLGVATHYRDGLGRPVDVSPETLVQVCAALGAEVATPVDASAALEARRAQEANEVLAPVVIAWDGWLHDLAIRAPDSAVEAELTLEDGTTVALAGVSPLGLDDPLPLGYHRLHLEVSGQTAGCTVIAAPVTSWRRTDDPPAWGVSAHLSALRSRRSRSVGDLHDLSTLSRWVAARGGDLVALLPLLPTFNDAPTEPSPYSPVSRLFWSELILDLGPRHRPVQVVGGLSVHQAEIEVRKALAGQPLPSAASIDAELQHYAAFRGAQRRLGRRWQSWPQRQRDGQLEADDVDPTEQDFHLVAQSELRRQLENVAAPVDGHVRLGLDLAVGVHPDGYDAWSRPGLFATTMSVGAPPDGGFPSGQGWGFPPVLPQRSREEGHAYLAASVAHQAGVAGVLRVDHVMAMNRLYWIPEGMGLADGTYVDYPTEELFAVLCLESHRNRCEVIGENLGTVPAAIDAALPRHDIRGMYLAQFAASANGPMAGPSTDEVAMIGTHDTPTLAGWLAGVDIDERVRLGLLAADAAPGEREARQEAAQRMADALGGSVDAPDELLHLLLDWLGRSNSPLVNVWLEDLWLETAPVNVPGSSSSERPNWQRPMAGFLDALLADPTVTARADALQSARGADSGS